MNPAEGYSSIYNALEYQRNQGVLKIGIKK
jgi:hypothetical protein